MSDVDKMMAKSREALSRISRGASGERPDRASVVNGATQAARVCVSHEGALSEALDLVRRFCSVHLVGLKAVALVIDAESDKIGRREPGHYEGGSDGDSAVRLLRVLIAALNAFLGNARSTGEHLEILDGTVAVIRRTIDNLTGDLGGPTAGMAAAKLRGLTAMACFRRLRRSSVDQPQDARWAENLVRMGNRDVDKLLKCISRQGKKDQASLYLRNPGSCIEALAALRRVATSVPGLYPKVAKAFADAVKCIDDASGQKWGSRPSLRDDTVRHTLVACSSHLADRVGRAPDEARLEAYNLLRVVLRERCNAQMGGRRILDTPPSPRSAVSKSCIENAPTDKNPGHSADGGVAKMAKTVHHRTGTGGGTPSEPSMAPIERGKKSATLAAAASSGDSRGRILGICRESPAKAVTAAAAKRHSADPRLTSARRRTHSTLETADKRHTPDAAAAASTPPAPASPLTIPTIAPATHQRSNRGDSWRLVKATAPRGSSPCAPTASPRTLIGSQGEARASPIAPPEGKVVHPPLETKLDGDSPNWKEGERYKVVLGKTFYREAGGGGSNSGKGDGSGHYVHLKYDFVPGRTSLDAPATLRQGPLTGADGKTDGDGLRWAAEMVYESRDPENPRPVRFSGDAARAQDAECVLVFDGNMFVMDRVSVVGGLKNVQDFSGPVVRSAGGATLEASMARRKKKEARPKKASRDRDDQVLQQQQQPKEKKKKVAAVVKGQGAGASSSEIAEGEGSTVGNKTNNANEKKRKERKTATMGGVTINPANMLSLSQPKSKKYGGDSSALGQHSERP